jgi:serine/threonine-protein kinase
MMSEPHDPNRTVDVPSTPAGSLDAGQAAGFNPASALSGLRSSVGSQRPVLLREAEGESDLIVKPKSDAMPTAAEAGDRYQLAGEIARGGMGAVLRGRDVDLGRNLAVKVLLEKYIDRPDVAQRFLEEAQIGGQLQHPGVVPVYDIGCFGKRPFFTMKLVKGKTLATLLGERTHLAADRPRLLGIALHVAQTLAYAHARGVIHRDLKPSNIMVGAFGEVQVMDWGLAKVLAEGGGANEEPAASREHEQTEDITTIRTTRRTGSGAGTQTETGSLLGTPAYIPPEQANGDIANLDRRADVFGLGALLCEILTGKPPYVGRSNEEVRRKAANGDLADALARLDSCGADAELLALTQACLSPEASDRPRDARAVADALTTYLDGVQARLRQAEVAEAEARARAAEEVKRRWVTLALAVTALLAVTLGGGGWLWIKSGHDARQAQRTRDIQAALNRATELREQAQVPTTASAAQFAQAREQAQWALALIANEPVDAVLKEQVLQLQSTLDAEDRDRKLLAALDAARLAQAQTRSKENRYDFEQAVPLFRKAFEDYGLPAGQGTPKAAAERLRQRPAAVREGVSAALDEWIDLATDPEHKITEPDLDWLRAVAAALELEEGWTRELRTVLAAKDRAKQQAGLEKLAREADVRKVPVRALHRLARRLVVVERRASALQLLRRAQRQYPADFWMNHGLGWMFQNATPPNLEEAVRWYTGAVALRPDSPGAHYNLGVALADRGRIDEAMGSFGQAIQLEPKYAAAHYNLGIAWQVKGQHDKAIACFHRAAVLEPNAWRLTILGHALWANGQLDDAIVYHRWAIALDPKFAVAHLNLGIALTSKGRLDEAITSLRLATELAPKFAMAHNDLGVALAQQGQWKEAIACYNKAIALDPKLVLPHTNLGDLFYAKGWLDEAIACYRQVILRAPNSAAAHSNLGNALADKGLLEEAIDRHCQAIALDPNYVKAYTNLGNALTAKGQFDEAIACYQKAIELDPKDGRSYGALGLALLRKGRYAEAQTASARALELLPDNDPLRAVVFQQRQASALCLSLGKRLPCILLGKGIIGSAPEGLNLAALCRLLRKHDVAVDFAANAFIADPKVADNVVAGHRFNAACAAVLAAAGQDEDADRLDQKRRIGLRRQAFAWLRADLAAWRKVLDRGPPAARALLPQVLRYWQQNSDLASVRDPAALVKLPVAECALWVQLWVDVAILLDRAENPPGEPTRTKLLPRQVRKTHEPAAPAPLLARRAPASFLLVAVIQAIFHRMQRSSYNEHGGTQPRQVAAARGIGCVPHTHRYRSLRKGLLHIRYRILDCVVFRLHDARDRIHESRWLGHGLRPTERSDVNGPAGISGRPTAVTCGTAGRAGSAPVAGRRGLGEQCGDNVGRLPIVAVGQLL